MISKSAKCQSLYRLRYLLLVGRYVDLDLADISADTSVDTSTDISRSSYRPRVGRYDHRNISRLSADISTDTSVECWSIWRLIYQSRGAQNRHDPEILSMWLLKLLTNGKLWAFFPLQENSAHNIWSSPQLTQFVMMFNKVHRNFPFYVVSLSCLPPIFFFVFSSLALYFQEWRVDHNENLVLIPVVRRPN